MTLTILRRGLGPVLLSASAFLISSTVQAQAWLQHATSTPGAREEHATAIEAGTGEVLLFGGQDLFQLDDTWSFNGVRWFQRTVLGSPPPARSRSAMATDPLRGVTVLFSGSGGANDTWEWNGLRWIQFQTTPTDPPQRLEHAMAFDPIAGVIVLFGGNNGSSLNDTWTFNGTAWTQIALAGAPPAREEHTLEFDPLTGSILLFGGFSAPLGTLGDTWSLNTAMGVWTQLFPATSPPARANHAMAFDGGSGGMVVIGGVGGATQLGDQWIWDGVTWTPTPFLNTPPAREGHSLDLALRGRLTTIDGRSLGTPLDETWSVPTGIRPAPEFSPAAFDPLAAGCPGVSHNPRLTSNTAPIPGSNFVMDLSGFAIQYPVAFVSLGIVPATQSCNPAAPSLGHVSLITPLVVGLNNRTAAGPNQTAYDSLSVAVPNIVGLTFMAQAYSLESPSGPLIGTNQIRATIGF